MAISADNIVGEQQVLTRTPDGKDLAFLTGTALFSFKGTGGAWRRDVGVITTQHGPVWAGVESTAATAALAAVANDGTAVNEGYAADEVRVFVDEATHRIQLQVDIAVRDSDGRLYRVSYQVTVLGYIRRGILPMGPSSTGGVLG
jgi:hypothetical protein